MGRIGKAYEARFRALLLRVRARKLEQGVRWLIARANQVSAQGRVPLTTALGQVYEALRTRITRWQRRADRASAAQTPFPKMRPSSEAGFDRKAPRFLCDAGLGGLARWLRAAGSEAFWFPDIADADLVREAGQLGATLLTTDSLLMERRILRDGLIPALWLPPTLTKVQQLALVFRELDLERQPPRCMSCGGTLRAVGKESMRERIPPRTWRWIDEYFVCARCNQLFWHGTHWQKIRQQLAIAAGEKKSASPAPKAGREPKAEI